MWTNIQLWPTCPSSQRPNWSLAHLSDQNSTPRKPAPTDQVYTNAYLQLDFTKETNCSCIELCSWISLELGDLHVYSHGTKNCEIVQEVGIWHQEGIWAHPFTVVCSGYFPYYDIDLKWHVLNKNLQPCQGQSRIVCDSQDIVKCTVTPLLSAGIEPVGNVVMKKAVFTVETISAGMGEVLVYVEDPAGHREEVRHWKFWGDWPLWDIVYFFVHPCCACPSG